MSAWINFNGQIVADSQKLFGAENRAFRYGDGFFETIRCYRGRPLWMPQHIQRIENSARLLKMTLPDKFGEDYITRIITDLLTHNRHMQGARVRLAFYRNDVGFYRPQTHDTSFLVESSALENENYVLNDKGLFVGVYTENLKGVNLLSSLKTSSALLYVMAAQHARDKKWDDAFILNDRACLAEATSSNIFLVEDKKIYTPAIDQGCVEGVMRNVVMPLAVKEGYKLNECELKPEDLLQVDEVFITNTISGIQWVKGFASKRYYHDVANKLLKQLNSLFVEK